MRFGLVTRGPYSVADRERTVLDFAYWDHYREAKGRAATREWLEHIDRVDRPRLAAYLPHHPAGVRERVEAKL